jgi:hypothetical protein
LWNGVNKRLTYFLSPWPKPNNLSFILKQDEVRC